LSFKSFLLLLLVASTDAEVRVEPHEEQLSDSGVFGRAMSMVRISAALSSMCGREVPVRLKYAGVSTMTTGCFT
jgi:hypothetical protein